MFVLPSSWLDPRPDWLAITPGWVVLRSGWLAMKPDWLALRLSPKAWLAWSRAKGRTDVPILQDFVPYRGRFRKSRQLVKSKMNRLADG